ncbi:unnamed protein product, partial [Protopolystoma xenopodis]
MYNVCTREFGTFVFCDKETIHGHDPSNLLAKCTNISDGRAMLCSSITRPPVCVLFSFPHAVILDFIASILIDMTGRNEEEVVAVQLKDGNCDAIPLASCFHRSREQRKIQLLSSSGSKPQRPPSILEENHPVPNRESDPIDFDVLGEKEFVPVPEFLIDQLT